MVLPKLPPGAAYIHLTNPSTPTSALSLATLQHVRTQLRQHLQDPDNSADYALLPAFKPHVLESLEADAKLPGSSARPKLASRYSWLVRPAAWHHMRADRPHVLVLRSDGPDFSTGPDPATMPDEERRATLRLCAQVMALLRRSAAIVVAPVHGPASAAGFQLAMMADVTIALASTPFSLPGMEVGRLPGTSALGGVGRTLAPRLAFRMAATAEPVTAGELGASVLDVVPVPEDAGAAERVFEERVASVVAKLAAMPGRAQALEKWAFWTQMSMRDFRVQEAGEWAERVMALHAKHDYTQDGLVVIKEKRARVSTQNWDSVQDEESEAGDEIDRELEEMSFAEGVGKTDTAGEGISKGIFSSLKEQIKSLGGLKDKDGSKADFEDKARSEPKKSTRSSARQTSKRR